MTSVDSITALAGKNSDEVFASLKTSAKGLTPAEAARRLKLYGINEFAGRKKLRPFLIFAAKFKNPLLLLLIVAAIISGVLGSRFEAGVILVIVFGSAVIDFFNSYKSAQAAEALREKVTITAAVMRGGELKERNMREVVPGDIFSLEAGDLVPADGMVIDARDLFLNEGVLTGESSPVEKKPNNDSTSRTKNEAAQNGNVVYLGTSVVSGKATVVAVATGMNTKVGTIAGKLVKPDQPTEFEKNIKDFSLFIFRVTLFLVLAVILLNIFFLRRDPLQIFIFAVAIAVGLTPELLPLIVTSNLAKGALRMSEHGVIVKKLAAIHNFGSVDVLCTDKTGTLTEDRIALIRCLDPLGEESEDTFFWGYVSSMHLTGVRGVLDKAIEEFKERSKALGAGKWEKVDEIPFDAERRIESVIVKNGATKTVLISKGAPEEILKDAAHYGAPGKEKKMTAAMRTKISKEYDSLSADGFRVLAVGAKEVPRRTVAYKKEDEKETSFVGFLAFLDPPKKTVKDTLARMALHHVAMKIITGDNFLVTKHIAEEIGLPMMNPLTGDDLAKLDEHQLRHVVDGTNIFTRVNPEQKELIIRALRDNGHVVAYMGDGVNDVLSLKAADVGISVNNAVDIAKETADIILLNKGLGEIIDGIVEGRKTFANTFKYLQMALSSNFGNMFSMPIASVFLPFLPMTAPQILLNNFLYDSSQLAIPFDNVDPDFLERPKKFDIGFMKKFMYIFGPLSSLFDFITFGILLLVFHLSGSGFQTGWFLESIATQTLVVNIIRTRFSFWKNGGPSKILMFATFGAVAVAWGIAYSPIAPFMNFIHMGIGPVALIVAVVAVYLFAVELAKKAFYKKYGGLIER
jgi:Mg2+-importing ATPase